MNYTSALCKVNRDVAERVWEAMENTKTMLPKEKQKAINKVVGIVCVSCDIETGD